VQEIHIRFRIAAPLDAVFDAVTDHENFLADGMTRTTITRSGAPERNGTGCLREVRATPLVRFVEEITRWERPASYEYFIRETSLPLRHHGGRIELTPAADGTMIDWTTRFEVTVPVVARVLEPIVKRILARTFDGFLRGAKGRLEGAHG
jgi:hypothetical protein